MSKYDQAPLIFRAHRLCTSHFVSFYIDHFYIHEGNPGRDLELTKNLYPQRTLLKDFVQKNLGELLPK